MWGSQSYEAVMGAGSLGKVQQVRATHSSKYETSHQDDGAAIPAGWLLDLSSGERATSSRIQ
jgi:hypothetical protein